MTVATSIWLFQVVFAIGLANWFSIAAINNVCAFRASAWAVGNTMAMTPLSQDPRIDIPLLTRAISSPALHRLALMLVILLQIIAAVTCWLGSYQLVVAGDLTAARAWLNLALCSFAAFIFAMHLGGLWFAYWIRQGELQLTHISLLLWVLAAFFLFNFQWTS
jgi:predicted small integral membrane protein